MTNEIKEILDIIKKVSKAEVNSYNGLIETPPMKWEILLDYITNLQKEYHYLYEFINEYICKLEGIQDHGSKTYIKENLKLIIDYMKERFMKLTEYYNISDCILERDCYYHALLDIKDKLLCYGETFDSKIHQEMQKELLDIVNKAIGEDN